MMSANVYNKAVTPVAVAKMNKFPIHMSHLTTANFMEVNIPFAKQLVPKAHGKLVHKTFARADVLDRPCLGSAQFHNRAFWVPFRTVWEPWSDFITDTPHNQPSGTSLIPNTPVIPWSVFVSTFTGHSGKYASITTGTVYDFQVGSTKYVFTSVGRHAYKILRSLGYGIIWDYDKDSDYPSVLPLLCACKVFIDWYYPSAYAHYGIYASLDGILQRQVTYSLTSVELDLCLDLLRYVSYDNDFFASCWDNPTGPNSNTGSTNFQLVDPTLTPNSGLNPIVIQDNNGTPWSSNDNPNPTNQFFSVRWDQWIDSSIKALTQYVKRHQLAGARALDRYLLQYGVSLDADKLKRCVYLGEDSFPFEIGDVMSTADTSGAGGSGASLGAYAGKGIAYSAGGSFDFDSAGEYGFLFVFETIIPDVAYVQGWDRNVMCKYKLDFLNGEFDALGPDAVCQAEILLSKGGDVNGYNPGIADRIFGYAPRYYYLKIGQDRMSGDFACDSVNADLAGWSTVRLFDPNNYASGTGWLKHDFAFVQGGDALQYDRMFLAYPEVDSPDPFKIVHHSFLDMYAPMKPLYDDCLFDDLDDHQKVTSDPNGVKMN